MTDTKRDDKLLNHGELKKIPLGEKLSVDYFYVPEFFYEEDEFDHDFYLVPLIFESSEGIRSPKLYASKVPAGMTLWQAVGKDLERDFNYPKDNSFRIDGVALYDIAEDKSGNKLTRVNIEVVVDLKFKTDDLNPVDFKVYWES